jgi:hypothetical protein
VKLEDLFETVTGMEITDEASVIAVLPPTVAESRKRRLAALRRKRAQTDPSPRDGGRASDRVNTKTAIFGRRPTGL